MLNGYTGRMLRADLSRRRFEVQSFDENIYRRFTGGSGLAAWIMFTETSAQKVFLTVRSTIYGNKGTGHASYR
jgi:aldehyde:ferredoxin oxidoreductase